MIVSQSRIDQSVQRFLVSQEAEELFEDNITPLWMSLFITVLIVFAGLFLIGTLVGAWFGIKLLLVAFKGEAFKGHSGGKFKNRRDEARGLIAHLIMAGPAVGPGGKRAALVLGAFDEVPFTDLCDVAKLCSAVYSGDQSGPRYQELKSLLQDDTYQHDRRRVVPEAFRKGHRLYLFDLKIDPPHVEHLEDATLTGVLALPGKDGAALQLPWHVVSDAILDEA